MAKANVFDGPLCYQSKGFLPNLLQATAYRLLSCLCLPWHFAFVVCTFPRL